MNSEAKGCLSGLSLLLAGSLMLGLLNSERPTEISPVLWTGMGRGRTLVADWLWLETDLAWEARDAARTRYLIELTLTLNPDPEYFWLNSARMIAYDLPAWIGEAKPGESLAVPIFRRHAAAEEALRLLQRGLRSHPGSVALNLEMGNISLYGLGDIAGAARFYRVASLQPGAPACAGRISRHLLERAN